MRVLGVYSEMIPWMSAADRLRTDAQQGALLNIVHGGAEGTLIEEGQQ